jgi:hypothetical protein
MYIKPYPSEMSPEMALDALSRLNSSGIDYEISSTDEIMVSTRYLLKPETSSILISNVYYDLCDKHGSPMTYLRICLNYERRYLKFYAYESEFLEIDYRDGSRFVFPEWKKSETIKEISRGIFDDPDFLSI